MGFTKATKTTFIVSTILAVLTLACLVFVIILLGDKAPDNSGGQNIGWGFAIAIFWPICMIVSGACTLGSAIPFFIMLKRMKGKVLALNLTAMIVCAVLTILVGVLPVIIL